MTVNAMTAVADSTASTIPGHDPERADPLSPDDPAEPEEDFRSCPWKVQVQFVELSVVARSKPTPIKEPLSGIVKLKSCFCP